MSALPRQGLVAATGALWLATAAVHGLLAVLRHPLGTAPSWLGAALWMDEAGRIERTLARRDQLLDMPDGTHLALWKALSTLVPEDGVLHVDVERDARQARAAKPILVLGFPRRVVRHRGSRIEALWPEGEYALFFGDARVEWLTGRRTLLASGPDWTLWR